MQPAKYLLLLATFVANVLTYSPTSQGVIDRALVDGIDLTTLPFAQTALASIDSVPVSIPINGSAFANATKIDTHVHIVPEWYRMLVPTTGGSPTPSWNAHDHFAFMASNGIKHGVMSISAPGTGVYDVVGGYSEHAAAALARLLNEYLAALAGAYPEYLSFYAVMPLPYSERAFKEATYALECLGASGMGVLSNHEGKYIGNPAITPFFARLNGRNASKTVVSVHPNEPVLNLNGTFISADPTVYSSGLVEFYFETARTVMDLTISQTILNFTHLY